MNYTKNYYLPQWKEEDRIMMGDFNAAMANIENGLVKTDRDAAQAAQKTADNAYSRNKLPYTAGTYMGNGTSTTVELGYKPSFIIVTGQVTVNETNFVRSIIVAIPGIMSTCITFLSNGFSIKHPDSSANRFYPQLNVQGEEYGYIAFR